MRCICTILKILLVIIVVIPKPPSVLSTELVQHKVAFDRRLPLTTVLSHDGICYYRLYLMLLMSTQQIAVDRLHKQNKFDQLSRQRKYDSFTPYSYFFVVDHAGTIPKGCGELGFSIA